MLKHMEQTGKLRDLRIDEVVLAADSLSLIKQLNSSRDVSVFYEGQNEQDKQVLVSFFYIHLKLELMN